MKSLMRQIGLLWFLVVLIGSCTKKEARHSQLFPIDSLVSAQSNYLALNKASLTKCIRLGDKSDKVSSTPIDTTTWEKELEIFTTLEIINKPVNKDLYRIENAGDAKSNLKVKAFTTEFDLPVKYLKIYYQDSLNKIRKIEAQYNESNSLYESTRILTMEFQQINNKTVITSYSIVGGQKMFLGDSVEYNISGLLSISN